MSRSWAGSAMGASVAATGPPPRLRASTASGSLTSPGANSLMPLSRVRVVRRREITAPIALWRLASNATTGVETRRGGGRRRPRWRVRRRTPPRASPWTGACHRRRRPRTAVAGASTWAAARPRSRANDAVRSELATPRTPSVPNFTTNSVARRSTRGRCWGCGRGR